MGRRQAGTAAQPPKAGTLRNRPNSGIGLLRWFWSALCGHKKASISFRPHRVDCRNADLFALRCARWRFWDPDADLSKWTKAILPLTQSGCRGFSIKTRHARDCEPNSLMAGMRKSGWVSEGKAKTYCASAGLCLTATSRPSCRHSARELLLLEHVSPRALCRSPIFL